jgi:hypothetical protein
MYETSSSELSLNDSPAQIDFHIQTDDYFAFLATVMGFLEEALDKCESELLSEQEVCMARELRNDLRYVQANYRIQPRQLDEIQTIRSSGNQLVGG